MKDIIKYAEANKISSNKNIIIKKSLENRIQEDRVIKIITNEVGSFISRLLRAKD